MGNYATQHLQARRSKILWGAGVAAFGVVDTWRMSKDDDSTFSCFLRWLFQTGTVRGRLAFLAALAVLAWHILK